MLYRQAGASKCTKFFRGAANNKNSQESHRLLIALHPFAFLIIEALLEAFPLFGTVSNIPLMYLHAFLHRRIESRATRITYHLLMRLGLVGLTLIASSHFLQALGQNMYWRRNK